MIELVGKIGSMALIDEEKKNIDYNVFAQISMCLKPGYVWVTSGATEIGRIDYIKRSNMELDGDKEESKTDYASQGQAILMENYRKHTNIGGINAFSTNVEKPFITTTNPYREFTYLWRSGMLLSYYHDWFIEDFSEYIVCEPQHAVNQIYARKM